MRYVTSWKKDYETLKHYRFIRNQIAHENYADESNLCTINDQVWIDEFYKCILKQEDSLAVYYKKQHNRKIMNNTRESEAVNITNKIETNDFKNQSYAYLLLIVVLFIFLIGIFCFSIILHQT